MAEEVKELAPIVMVSEAEFIDKKLNPALAGLGLAEDVTTMDKA